MTALFEASKLKIERARHHLNELRANICGFMARSPIVIVVEKWAPPGLPEHLDCHAWTARIRQPIPAEFSTMMGDVVHNLRASLDLLACDLVRLNGQSAKDVYFPFAENAAQLERMIRKRNMYRASSDAVEVIRSLKPYKGGNEALRAIHDLDVADKHKALIPVANAVVTPPMGLVFGTKVNQIPRWGSMVINDGHAIVIMPAVSNVPVGTVLPGAASIVFGPDVPLSGREVTITFEELTELADGIRQAFAAHFQGRDESGVKQ